MLLKDPHGQLPEFMCYFQGYLARAVNVSRIPMSIFEQFSDANPREIRGFAVGGMTK